MVPRTLASYAQQMADKYPVVTVTGPRQSGKTTMVRMAFPEKPYVNLEAPNARAFAESDPVGFAAEYPDGAILDEIQRAPSLLSQIQVVVDEARRPGMFVLTGSHQFDLREGISQSLAGRTAVLHLLPFSLREIEGYHVDGLNTLLHRGFYPRVYDQDIHPAAVYRDYVETYLERDLRRIVHVRNLSTFQRFLRLCAGWVGRLLNLSTLASDTGITQTTASEWLSVLEASFIAFRLPPYHANIRKRLVKTPKLYFYDVGLASWLCGIEEERHVRNHPLRGNLMENLVVAEIMKHRFNAGRPANCSFYRDSTGNEVDVIYSIGPRLVPIEIKASQTIAADFFKGFAAFDSIMDQVAARVLVYAGNEQQRRTTAEVVGYRQLPDVLDRLDAI